MGAVLELFGIPSPALFLGILLAVLAAGGLAYHEGHVNGYNAAESARAGAQDKALNVFGKELALARESAVAEAARRAAAAAEADVAKTHLTTALRSLRDEKNKPAPSCVPKEWVLKVNTAIAAANGATHK
jgi:hypothetical protein